MLAAEPRLRRTLPAPTREGCADFGRRSEKTKTKATHPPAPLWEITVLPSLRLEFPFCPQGLPGSRLWWANPPASTWWVAPSRNSGLEMTTPLSRPTLTVYKRDVHRGWPPRKCLLCACADSVTCRTSLHPPVRQGDAPFPWLQVWNATLRQGRHCPS